MNSLSEYIIQARESVLLGIVTGVAIQKSRVINPINARNSFMKKCKILGKVSQSATLAGLLCYTFISYYSPDLFKRIQNEKKETMKRGIIPSIFGGLILGVGIALCGACPAIAFLHIGSFVENSLWLIGGCLIGSFIYGYYHKKIEYYLVSSTPSKIPPTLNELLNISYYKIAPFISILLLYVVYNTERQHPWKSEADIEIINDSYNIMKYTVWAPEIGGIIVGLLSIPAAYLFKSSLEFSSQYITIISQFYDKNSYFMEYKSGIKNWWRLYFMIGCCIGSFLSFILSSKRFYVISSIPFMYSLVGGILISFGSRLSEGCTIGNSMNGLSLLSTSSFISSISLFCSAIPTSLLLTTRICFGEKHTKRKKNNI